MADSERGPTKPVRRWTAVVRQVARPRARMAAVAALIAGMAGDLAAHWRQPEAHPGTGSSSHHQRTHGGRHNAPGDHTHGQGRNPSHGSVHHHPGHAGGEAKPTPTPTPTPIPTGDGGGGHGGGGGGSGHGHGNAGSAFFNRPLATKTRRRAHGFAHHHANAGSQPNGISVSTGPDGATIQTHIISYHAAPTPLPTPFPALTLPGQGAAPSLGAISGTPTPSAHHPVDTSGGNTSTRFMS